MRFDKIAIDSYGVFHKRYFDFSQGNFFLVYGRNENGKSTLLSGMRSIVFGYKKRSGENRLFSNMSSVAGGRIEFRLRDGREGSVFRSWKAADASEQVFRAAIAGREVDCQELFDAIGCADRDFFSNFFGLSYADQATGERKLRAENLSRVIYGLSVGDADRFERARKILNDRREKLFKATGSTPRLNVALDKFLEAKNKAAVSNETREYREAENDKKQKENQIVQLRKNADDLQRQASYYRALSDAYDDFLCFQNCGRQLEEFRSRFDRTELEKFSAETAREYQEKSDGVRQLEGKKSELSNELKKLGDEKEQLSGSLNRRYDELKETIEDVYKKSLKFEDGLDGLLRKSAELDKREDVLARTLKETGAVFDDSSPEARRAAFETYLQTIEKAVLTDAESYMKAETDRRRDEETSISKRRKVEDEIRAAEDELKEQEARQKELFQDFGMSDVDAAKVEYEAVRDAFSGVEEQLKSAKEKAVELRRELKKEETDARSLGSSARDDGRELDPFELEAFLARMGRQSEPIGLEDLKKSYDAASLRVDTRCESLTDSEKELKDLRRKIQAKEAGIELMTIEEKLKDATEARDRLWNEVKVLLLAQEERAEDFYRTARETARSYENAVADADRINQKRYDSASTRGEIRAFQAQYGESSASLAKEKREYERLCQERDQILSEANQLLERCGFDFCAQWSLETSVNWYLKWRDQRALHNKNAEAWNRLVELVQGIVREFRRVVNLARVWKVEDVDEATLTESLEDIDSVEAVLASADRVKTLLSRIQTSVARYDELFQKIRDVKKTLKMKRDELAEYASSIESNHAALRELDDQREKFSLKLPFRLSEPARKSWDAIFQALGGIRAWQEAARNFNDDRQEYEERDDEYRRLEERVHEIAAKLGVEQTQEKRFDADVKTWRDASIETGNKLSRIELIESSLKEASEKLKPCENDLATCQRALAEIEEKTNVSHSDFSEFLTDAEKLRELRNAYDSARNDLFKRVQTILGGKSFDECVADFTSGDRLAFDSEYERLHGKAEELREEERRLNQEIGKHRKTCDDLLARVGEYEKEANYQTALAELRACVDEYAPVQLALDHLDASIKSFEKEKVPAVLKSASQYLSRITGGRFVGIERVQTDETRKGRGAKKADSSADDMRFNEGETVGYRVVSSDETFSFLDSSELSQGTLEQLLFTIRLALIDEYCDAPGSEPLPVIMDDVFVQYDDARLSAALELLKEIAADDSRQIILMTHHEGTRRRFSEIVGEERVVDL